MTNKNLYILTHVMYWMGMLASGLALVIRQSEFKDYLILLLIDLIILHYIEEHIFKKKKDLTNKKERNRLK